MRRDKAIQYFKLARYMAETFSKDPSTKVGTILLKEKTLQILSVGYNGFARGVDETKPERWERPTKYNFCVHSEINSICNAARSGTSVEGAIAIVTMYPCCDCCRALIQSGVKNLITLPPNLKDPKWGEEFKTSKIMMEESGVEITLLDREELAI
jgi:dCMP deaminase